ncbi:hypothetical protein BH10ACT6_BH10ACT6_07910 [soil metagenome]
MITTAEVELWDVFLQDSDWVDAEFAAIMNASGFGDRVIVGVSGRPRQAVARSPRRSRWRAAQSSSREAVSRSRVRSPPRD